MWDVARHEAKVGEVRIFVVKGQEGRDEPSSEQAQKNTIFIAFEFDVFLQAGDLERGKSRSSNE
jgi:hypothetical protein